MINWYGVILVGAITVLTNETARSFLVVSVKSSSSQGLIDIFQIPPPPIPLLHMAVTIGVPVYPHIDNSILLYIAELGNVMFVLNSSIYLTMRGHWPIKKIYQNKRKEGYNIRYIHIR